MWADDNMNELKERVSQMSDEELLKMVGEDYDQYRREAIQLAEAELESRGIELVDEETVKSEDKATMREPGEFINSRKLDEAQLICQVCGNKMRAGYLYAQREVTIMFADNNEERFVEVLACSRCGQVRLLVDYETQVDEG